MSAITPPVLMSRLMSFVLAAAIATALALLFAVTEMFPLSKTQVFLLSARRAENQIIEIKNLSMNDKSLEIYKENFIKEYIRARNEILPNVNVMRIKWRTDGPVRVWSESGVYAKFIETRMWRAFMQDAPDFSFSCPVEFQGKIEPLGSDKYTVRFRYFCSSDDTDNAGQIPAKDFTIVVGLAGDDKVDWGARLENPLGVKVSEYKVVAGGGDPLDFD